MSRLITIIFSLAVLLNFTALPAYAGFQEQHIFIMGRPELTPEQCITYIKHRNALPKINCSVEELVDYYYEEAGREGIRPDIALCQAILETNCFAFGRDVVPKQNNFCGLGTTGGGVKGAHFLTPRMGVRAHIQHLLAYCSDRNPQTPIVDPRFSLIKSMSSKYNQCTTWQSLDGMWAVPGRNYGENILKTFEIIKNMTVADSEEETVTEQDFGGFGGRVSPSGYGHSSKAIYNK